MMGRFRSQRHLSSVVDDSTSSNPRVRFGTLYRAFASGEEELNMVYHCLGRLRVIHCWSRVSGSLARTTAANCYIDKEEQ